VNIKSPQVAALKAFSTDGFGRSYRTLSEPKQKSDSILD